MYGGKTDCGFDHVAFMRTPFKKLHVLQMEMPKNKKTARAGECVSKQRRDFQNLKESTGFLGSARNANDTG